MNRRESVEFVNMCMIQNGDKVLVQDRVNPDWPGITFPGGHVERGESFVDAVIREVKEETGLTISNPQLCGIKDWYDITKKEEPNLEKYLSSSFLRISHGF